MYLRQENIRRVHVIQNDFFSSFLRLVNLTWSMNEAARVFTLVRMREALHLPCLVHVDSGPGRINFTPLIMTRFHCIPPHVFAIHHQTIRLLLSQYSPTSSRLTFSKAPMVYWQIKQARFSLTSKLERNKKYDKRQLTKAIRPCSSVNRIIFDWQRRVSGPATDYTVFISCSSIVVGIDSYAPRKEWSRFFLIFA